MNTDAVNSLIAEWARSDRDFAPDYVAPASVLAQRLENLHRKTVESIAGVNAYVETAGGVKGNTLRVGVRDNRSATAVETFCLTTAATLKAKGFRATIRKHSAAWGLGTLLVRLPDDIGATARAAHPHYCALLATLRSERPPL